MVDEILGSVFSFGRTHPGEYQFHPPTTTRVNSTGTPGMGRGGDETERLDAASFIFSPDPVKRDNRNWIPPACLTMYGSLGSASISF